MSRLNAHPLLRWRFAPAVADRLLIAPQDLRTADPTRASEIYAGRFAFAGKILICDGGSPFDIEPPSEEWADMLLGFGWLRHLRAVESGITRGNARALVEEWIALQARRVHGLHASRKRQLQLMLGAGRIHQLLRPGPGRFWCGAGHCRRAQQQAISHQDGHGRGQGRKKLSA